MPKMKTHSGAKKRFKVTGTGKVRGRHPFTSHILEKKSPKKKRALGSPKMINDHDVPRIKRMLGTGARKAPSGVKTAGRMPAGGDHK
jgi:large subunit ribosomal protein L35